MHKRRVALLGSGVMVTAISSVGLAQVPVIRNDLLYGLNRNNPAETLHQVRGFPTGTRTTSTWGANFIQSVEFDNLDGFRHNPLGNLLGMNFGVVATGGTIQTFDTRFIGGTNPGPSQQIFDFASHPSLTLSRTGGLSVSPQNNRVAFTGFDSGNTYVLDYTPGNSQGSGSPLTNPRQVTNLALPPTGGTSGTTWLDNDTLLALSPTGDLQRVTVTAGALSSVSVANLTTAAGTSNFSSLLYEPTMSPYVFASIAKFDGTTTTNRVFVLDPSASFAVVNEIDYSTSIANKSIREIAFDAVGNLYIGNFVNLASTPPGESIHVVTNAAANAATLAANGSAAYYTQSPVLSAQFSGLDVAASQLDYKTPGVTVDIKDRSHVQYYFQANPLGEIRGRVQTGYNGGAWNGTGIRSSTAAGTTGFAVGYANAASLGLIGQNFAGEIVAGPAVLFRFTRYGDANLDGFVNLQDFNRLAGGFGSTNAFWENGDFNYDGLVTLADFNLIAAQFGLSASADGPTADDWAALASAVPEPASVSLLAMFAASLMARRRR